METHWITAALSGDHVTIRQNSVTNSGTLTGIAALTLAARMASPQPALMNNGGSLLTSGDHGQSPQAVWQTAGDPGG